MLIDDLPAFWARLSERDDMPAKALAFTILTGCRSGEVMGARWEEIDLAGATWTMPLERMKGRREHRAPLARAAGANAEPQPHRKANAGRRAVNTMLRGATS